VDLSLSPGFIGKNRSGCSKAACRREVRRQDGEPIGSQDVEAGGDRAHARIVAQTQDDLLAAQQTHIERRPERQVDVGPANLVGRIGLEVDVAELNLDGAMRVALGNSQLHHIVAGGTSNRHAR
jgi:hypothetical protein